MAKHTNETLVFRCGAIFTRSGTSIARMDRGEEYTTPTERDANAKRFVQIWNLWPDVVATLQDLMGAGWVTEETEAMVHDILKRMEAVP